MWCRSRQLLLALGLASLPWAPPAQALAEPAWGCGFVAFRDIVNSSTNTWIAGGYAYAVGLPLVHTDLAITCWLQRTDEYDETGDVEPLGSVIPGTRTTCAETDGTQCFATNAPTTFVSSFFDPLYFCTHVRWFDDVTSRTTTRRSDPCDLVDVGSNTPYVRATVRTN